MKPLLFLSRFSLPVAAYLVANLTGVLANTTENKFYCGQSKNVPATMAKTSRGVVPVIHWVSTLGETYTPEYRCKVVSEKFQTFYNDGTLNYLTTGIVNQQPVICAAQKNNGPCSGVLFTLKPNSDPSRTLQRLLSIRDRAPGVVLNESAPQVYINMADFLNAAPIETSQPADDEAVTLPKQSGTITPPASTPHGNKIW
ncbi:COP23 domain-containing protein [Altericista sp. CCNU0014]|uniref:COP23 domain-containing protein n=1 Tax=Altericista sp. CCNU0014 TaxID=3082949 RepID=UPI00384D75AF